MSGRPLGLDHLPVEILYDVHTYALSPALPLTSKYLYAVFKSAPNTVHADYLIGCYEEHVARTPSVYVTGTVSLVLRYPLCSRDVLEAIFRRSPSSLAHPTPPPGDPKRGRTIIPRRLFQPLAPRSEPWTEDDEPLPFLRFLASHAHIADLDANSHGGYPLTRAVYAGHIPLVRFLLVKGATPRCNGNLAVTVAIRRKSLALVRMLVERDGPHAVHEDSDASVSRKRKRVEPGGVQNRGEKAGGGAGVAGPSSSGTKRRKLGDRVAVTQEMLKTAVKCDARDIVDYLMKEKGCVPDMQTVLMMSRSN